MTKPYYLTKRGNIWYYRLANEKTYHSSGSTRESDAHDKAVKALAQRGPNGSLLTFWSYAAPFFTDVCPHCARMEIDGRPLSLTWRQQQRSRLDRCIKDDPIAKKRISDITPGDLEDLKARLVKGTYPSFRGKPRKMTPANANYVMKAVKTVLREAVHRREILYDPTATVRPLHHATQSPGIFEPDELRILIKRENWSSENRGWPGSPYPLVAPFAFAWLFATTGTRPASLLALKWSDVTDGQMHVRIVKTRNPYFVPLLPETIAVLDELREEAVRVADDDKVFSRDDGTDLRVHWFEQQFHAAITLSGLEPNDALGNKRTPYSLKHSLITALLNAGADELLVREYVGHSHTSGVSRVLTAAQRHYYRGASAEKLAESLFPIVRQIFGN